MKHQGQDPLPHHDLQVSLLRDKVVDVLRQAVVEMRLRPGQRLVERELIDWLGVSRATLREAIRELAAEGLVKTIPQQGAVVAVPTAEEAAELYEVRATLEGIAARKFVERAQQTQVRALRRSFEALKRAASSSQSIPAILQAKRAFYDALFEGASCRTIQSLVGSLQARITVLRSASLSRPGRIQATISELEALIQAVEAKDPVAAEKACREHVMEAGRVAIATLESPEDRVEAL